jgi:hypothetical protein
LPARPGCPLFACRAALDVRCLLAERPPVRPPPGAPPGRSTSRDPGAASRWRRRQADRHGRKSVENFGGEFRWTISVEKNFGGKFWWRISGKPLRRLDQGCGKGPTRARTLGCSVTGMSSKIGSAEETMSGRWGAAPSPGRSDFHPCRSSGRNLRGPRRAQSKGRSSDGRSDGRSLAGSPAGAR